MTRARPFPMPVVVGGQFCGRLRATRTPISGVVWFAGTKYDALVSMARLQGQTHAEIAATLGKSEPACRMLLRRALVALAALLDRGNTG